MTHPRTDSFDALETPADSAAALGYRMPAEFEPVDRIWLTDPHNEETWPGCLDEARAQFAHFAEAAARYATVETTNTRHGWPTDDSWIRDYGPIFVVNPDRPEAPLAAHDFHFNGWGGKYGEYPNDDVIPQRIAQHLGVPLWLHDMALEGGGVEVNGRGAIMLTESCLLAPTRNPHMSRNDIERALAEALNVHHFIWLKDGLAGDDTDGHIDTLARFVSESAVIALRAPADPGHIDHAALERNWKILQRATDQSGAALELFELPVPPPMHYDYPPDRFSDGGRNLLPASYANFLIVNNAVLALTFDQPTDDAALRALDRAFPSRDIIPIPSRHLTVGLGGPHCLSMQQPRT